MEVDKDRRFKKGASLAGNERLENSNSVCSFSQYIL